MNVGIRPRNVNIISLCTGGGGLDLGVGLAMPNARSVVYVEREAFACAHLVAAMQKGVMDEAPIWSDVTTFSGRPWRWLVDGLIGGIPCQPHSLAGKRQGSEDDRDLWSDARRIIIQSGAWWCLIENVPGMLTAKPGLDPGAFRVWRDLQRLGFDVEGGLFTAAEVGASHKRERLFILGVANRYREHCHGARVQRQGRRRQLANSSNELGDNIGARLQGREPIGSARSWVERCAAERDCHSVEHATSERRGEGRTEPELRSWRESASVSGGAMGNTKCSGHDGRPHDTLRRSIQRDVAKGAGRSIDEMDDAEIARSRGVSTQPGRQDETGSHFDGTVSLFPPGPSDHEGWQAVLEREPELEPAFRRGANGLAPEMDFARVDRLRMLGNGVVPLQAAYAFRTLATRLAEVGSDAASKLVRRMSRNQSAPDFPGARNE